ncbi:SGNH/GDSL hydrolase family protein [Roseateles saccharophilus]|uniref:Lysophospholipase L1-like esterase n=1 Tax=Roseateles saccharophilus TaxID=304 RepID=A0A4R3VEB8_ROSSA|nr:SGNH/GDSL hydrolase family protein [Roseateles saccharophilus]MDG0832970.1 SGNH/GDSL hydrolase family protein [Roseateles saccharophilus]TCV02062.1 lysophospholipase L1-like esterase [Roseateles saccharophilus]
MIAKILLGPLLLWQGRRVRATALRLPEAAGPRAAEGSALRLLIVGDSSAAGVGAAHQGEALAGRLAQALAVRLGQPVGWQLVATSGHRSEQALASLAAAELAPADVLITSLGVNDVVDQVAPSKALAALDRIHALATERAGVRLSVHCAAPPMQQFPLLPQPLRWFFGRQAARFNAALSAAVSGQASRCVLQLPEAMQSNAAELMAEDGFHPGPRGYALWADALADQIVIGLGLPSRSMAT